MSCIIIYKGKKYSEEQFKEYFINNKQEFATSISKNRNVIDSFKRKMEGIDYVFSQSPEIASIGSKAQYLQYLSTIFPNSKVKDIVYHISPNKFDAFDNKYIGSKKEKASPDNSMGIFFSKDKDYIKTQDSNNELGNIVYPTLVNLKNPYPNWLSNLRVFVKGNLLDESSRKEYEEYKRWMINNNYDGFLEESKRELVVAFNAKDTYILASKQDVEGFKKFVNQPEEETSKKSETIQPNNLPSIDLTC